MKKLITVLSVIATIVVAVSGIIWVSKNGAFLGHNGKMKDNEKKIDYASFPKSDHKYAKGTVKPKDGQPIKNFELIAKESTQEISKGVFIKAFTYGDSVPGKEIRVNQGDFVRVKLINTLKEAVTIHWHGYPLLSSMDGVPGINQDAVKPGEEFIYEFSADVPGTYWYHSHQESSKQVDKGLYGALIVEAKDSNKTDGDYTFILDEWMQKSEDDMGEMESKGHGEVRSKDLELEEEKNMSQMYDIYTVNGKSGELIKSINLKTGNKIRMRFINAGYRTHGIHIPNQKFRIVSTDGQDIKPKTDINDKIINISPGERYDVEMEIIESKSFYIDFHDANKYSAQIKIPVIIDEKKTEFFAEKVGLKYEVVDLINYIEDEDFDKKYDREYAVSLSTKQDKGGLKYTINNKTYDELPALELKNGEKIRYVFENKSKVDHPMHIHGHFMMMLEMNGKNYTGKILKDTINVKPGEKIAVLLIADNPGNWIVHCHELHHASAGMMQKVFYKYFNSNYLPNPNNTFNKPE